MRTITKPEFDELFDSWSKFLVFFCWTNCVKCRAFEPELERVEWQMTVPLYKSNAEEDPEIAQWLQIYNVPHLILFNEKIREIEYDDVNTWDFILDYFWIRIPDEHDHEESENF